MSDQPGHDNIERTLGALLAQTTAILDVVNAQQVQMSSLQRRVGEIDVHLAVQSERIKSLERIRSWLLITAIGAGASGTILGGTTDLTTFFNFLQ